MTAPAHIVLTTPAGQVLNLDPAAIVYMTELGYGLAGLPIVLPGSNTPRTWLMFADRSWLSVCETKTAISSMLSAI